MLTREKRLPPPTSVDVIHVDTGEVMRMFPIDAREALATGKWLLHDGQPLPEKFKASMPQLPPVEVVKAKEAELLALLEHGFTAVKQLAEATGYEKPKGQSWKDSAHALALHIIQKDG